MKIMRSEVEKETKLTVSAGIAPNKVGLFLCFPGYPPVDRFSPQFLAKVRLSSFVGNKRDLFHIDLLR